MYYTGIDAHKKYLTIAIVDNQGELVREERRVPVGDGEPLLAALEGPRPLEAVVETGSFWPWIHDTLEPADVDSHLAHASRLEAIAQSKTKTDSVDAELLARMLGAGLIPEVYPKPPQQRELCRLIRHRTALVEERASLVNRIHGHLQQQGLQIGRERLQRKKGQTWLREEVWPWLSSEQKALVEGHQELIEKLNEQIGELDGRIREKAEDRPAARLLQAVPGIGPYRSVLLVAEITPIERFGRGGGPVRAHPGGSEPMGSGRPSVGDPEPYGSDPGQFARDLLSAAEATPRNADRPRGSGPKALPSHSRHALDGRDVARMILADDFSGGTGDNSGRTMQLSS